MAASKKNPGRLAPEQLVPDLQSLGRGVARPLLVHCGLLPTCPVGQIDILGVSFVKATEDITFDASGKQINHLCVGQIQRMDPTRVEAFVERLRRTVVRFDGVEPVTADSSGESVGDPILQGRRGRVITIPTDKEIEERQAQGRPVHPYQPTDADRPAIEFMFLQVCENQHNPEAGRRVPQPISETGLELQGSEGAATARAS